MQRALALSLIVLGAWPACPDDPSFVASEVVDATTNEVGPDTTPSDTTSDTPIDTTSDVAPEVSSGVPCARDCIVRVSDEDPVAFDALVDATGRATVVAFRAPSPGQYHLVVRRYDGTQSWAFETIGGLVTEPERVVASTDLRGDLHVLAEIGVGLTTTTTWFRRTDQATWGDDVFVPGRRCVMNRLLVRDDQLFGSCLDSDALELAILRLDGVEAESAAWTELAVLPGVGHLGRFGLPTFSPLGWDIDVLGQPHVGWTCCGSDIVVRYAWWDGDAWRDDELGPVVSTAGSDRRAARLALDAGGHPHVVHQQSDAVRGELVDRSYDASWDSDVVARAAADGLAMGQILELEADASGALHLVYQDDAVLAYRVYDGAWSPPRFATEPIDPASRSIALTLVGDVAHVVFADPDRALWWWTPAPPRGPR